MTSSMIPYSFVPGAKAKADEVNANFIALASEITGNLASANEAFSTINGTLTTINQTINGKADKSDFAVTEANTDLNNYKTKGTYIFSSDYIPQNAPNNNAGTLVVIGLEASGIIQVYMRHDSSYEIYIRNYLGSSWSSWVSLAGVFSSGLTGYYKFPNGLLLQWGGQYSSANVTYPKAYNTYCSVLSQKGGSSSTDTTTDAGFTAQSLTGFTFISYGTTPTYNWFAIGY